MSKPGLGVLWALLAWLLVLALTGLFGPGAWTMVVLVGVPLTARTAWLARKDARGEHPRVAPRVR